MKIPRDNPKSGQVVVGVLIFAAIVILLGLGRLNVFQRQVARRADRQVRLRETLAAESALSWLAACGDVGALPMETNCFAFKDGAWPDDSGRFKEGGWPSDFCIRPAQRVFPVDGAERERVLGQSANWTSGSGSGGVTYRVVECGNDKSEVGETVAWPGVDIPLDGLRNPLWVDSVFGLRYAVLFADICSPADGVGDILRFALTPGGTTLSQGDAKAKNALWLEQAPLPDGRTSVVVKYRDGGGDIQCISNSTAVGGLSKGLQLAGARVALVECVPREPGLQGLYAARELASAMLPSAVVSNFVESCRAANGLRLSIEADIKADRANPAFSGKSKCNFFWGVSVMPPYEYEILVRHHAVKTYETATFVAVEPSAPIRLRTYDAHGLPWLLPSQ